MIGDGGITSHVIVGKYGAVGDQCRGKLCLARFCSFYSHFSNYFIRIYHQCMQEADKEMSASAAAEGRWAEKVEVDEGNTWAMG